jgi:hypothetical protein
MRCWTALVASCVLLAMAGSASASGPPPQVTLYGDQMSLAYGFWFPNRMLETTQLIDDGQIGTTASDVARLRPKGIHTDYAQALGKTAPLSCYLQWSTDTRPTRYPGTPPPVVVVLDGSADILAGVPLVHIERNLTRIYTYMQSWGAVVVPVTPPPGATGTYSQGEVPARTPPPAALVLTGGASFCEDPTLTSTVTPDTDRYLDQFGYVAYTPAQEAERLALRRWILAHRSPLFVVDAERVGRYVPPLPPVTYSGDPVAGRPLDVPVDFREQKTLAIIVARAIARAQRERVTSSKRQS